MTSGETPHIANVVKITGNFMILSTVEALAEAYAFAEKNGGTDGIVKFSVF